MRFRVILHNVVHKMNEWFDLKFHAIFLFAAQSGEKLHLLRLSEQQKNIEYFL